MIDQENLKIAAIPVLEKSGIVYEKWKEVRARRANKGERVVTITSDGVETENHASEGDYVVENQTGAKERYLVSAQGFADRYTKVRDLEGGWGIYEPNGKVIAVELTVDLSEQLGFGEVISFEAPWGSVQRLTRGDYLVSPLDLTEIYGIASSEFHETYRKAG